MTVPLLTFRETGELDRKSIDKGFSELQLMGQAALASLYRLAAAGAEEKIKNGGAVRILCGSGNNGGDGMALAYHLLSWKNGLLGKSNIFIYKTGPSRSEAAQHYEIILREFGIFFLPLSAFSSADTDKNDILVEAILGTGQKPGLRSEILGALYRTAEIRSKKERPLLVSLDIPAGISETESAFASDRNLLNAVPDEIHCYGADKICLNLHPEICKSKKFILPMGFFPDSGRTANGIDVFSMDSGTDFASLKRSSFMHKYSAGYGIIAGGSAGMEGAASLACSSFFASGGGIMNCIVPSENSRRTLLKLNRSVMFRGFDSLLKLKIPGAFCMGPGLSEADLSQHSDEIFSYLLHLSEEQQPPRIILDAAASSIVFDGRYPEKLLKRTLLTPHTGEWIKIGGSAVTSTEALFREADKVKNMGCSVLIKDSASVLIANEDGKTAAFLRCMPAGPLAAAGSGDILAGILTAIFARKENNRKSIGEIVSLALALHYESAKNAVNPASENFPDLIRSEIRRQEKPQ